MAQPQVWTAADIDIEITDLTNDPVVLAHIRTPVGELVLIADIERFDRELVLARFHIQGENLVPNQLGWSRLRQLASAVAEMMDVDTILVKGAARTTGAVRGRIPRPIRFTRKLPASR